jgi:carbonic anhydrase
MREEMRPEAVLLSLREGNERFVAGTMLARDVVAERVATASAQCPLAVIIACSDARVPVETVFDQGVGDLFVVRAAGHVLESAGWASVWFAVRGLGVRTVVVLGHEACGAVRAALADEAPEGLKPVTMRIRRRIARDGGAVARDGDAVALAESEAIRMNVAADVEAAKAHLDGVAGDAGGAITVVGAVYSVNTGRVEWLDRSGSHE